MFSPRKGNPALTGQKQEVAVDDAEMKELHAERDILYQKLSLTLHDIFTERLVKEPQFITIQLPGHGPFKTNNHGMIRAVRDAIFEKLMSGELKAKDLDQSVEHLVRNYFEGNLPGFSALGNNGNSIVAKHSPSGLANINAAHKLGNVGGGALD